MAILKMKRLSLAVVRSQKEALLKELVKLGCVQFSEIDSEVKESEFENLLKREDSKLMTLKSQQASLSHALEILNRAVPEKTSLLSSPKELDSSAFLDETGVSGSIGFAESIIANDDKIKRISAEQSRLRSVIESLKPWEEFGMTLNCQGTDRAGVLYGSIPAKTDMAALESALSQVSEECELFPVSEDKTCKYVALVFIKEAAPALQEVLRDYSFTASTLGSMEGTAKECKWRSEEELKALEEEKENCKNLIQEEAVRRDDIKLTSDKIATAIAMAEAEEKLFGTESTVLMEGWMPAEKETELSRVFESFDCAWDSREPTEDEYPEVPVKLKNNKITNGLNMVTNMYSLPAYGTVDPNPLMAPFFILFFGLMMADMGYGLLMIIAAIVALKKIKPRDNTLSFCQLLLWGGIATFAMGALTGGLFSDAPYQIVHMFNPESTWQGLPYLFSPVYNSEMVLYGAMVLGAIHLNTGMVVNFIKKWKSGNKAGAVWEEGSQWVILVGGVLAVLKIGNISGIPVLLIIGIVMLLFGAGRESKGFGKVTAAFGCIYNTATGWFGDVLSYSRIMALMLAGGVVGQVFNTVAVMPAQGSGVNAFTIAAFIIIFLLGHAMNFALNLLGCYVHDLRLQCLEFFGKFYEDGGKPFLPLKISGKYARAKEN